MHVQLRNTEAAPKALTAGRTYRVLEIAADDYRILNDNGRPVIYESSLFSVVDPTEPQDWVVEVGDDGERYAGPASLERFDWERYFDDVPDAVGRVNEYLRRLGLRT